MVTSGPPMDRLKTLPSPQLRSNANADANNEEGDNNADNRQFMIFSSPFDFRLMSQNPD